MPWKVYEEDSKFCLHKVNPDGEKGELVACHDTRDEAAAQQRALYASEDKEITELAAKEIMSILDNPEIEDKASCIIAVYSELKARTDHSEPEPLNPDTYLEQPAVPEPTQPEKAKMSFISKIKEIYERVKQAIAPDPAPANLTIWKEGEVYWWLARYSNNFRDNDSPPEIISAASHQRFVALAKEGKAPMPELWLWHRKEWKFGKAIDVAYDDKGFALAIGTVDPGREAIAEALMNTKEQIGVSHGMPVASIQRDSTDSSIIIEHETREISPLPMRFAANKLTGFVVIDKEDTMIPDEVKKEWVGKLGIDEKTLSDLEAANAADADKAISEGLESKEATSAEVPQPATPAEVPSTPAEPAPVTEPVPALTVADLQAAFNEAVKPLIADIESLKAGLKEVKEAGDAQSAILKGTPTASLTALLGQFAASAIGSPETKVDGRTELAKSKPVETAPAGEFNMGIPFINQMLAGVKNTNSNQ